MKYKLYTTSQKAWDGMLEAIRSAKSKIYMEMYIFVDDTGATYNFLDLLKEKAQAGLDVIVVADSFGSAKLSAGAIKGLKEAGVEFRRFSHWLRHTHRKILIIDNRLAFIGGVNIREDIRHWQDLQIRLSGRIVKPILKSFAYSYKLAGGKREEILAYSRKKLSQKLKAWVTDNFSSTTKQYYLNSYYRQKLAEASHLVQIVTPYLLPPRWLLAALDQACQRGVKVEIIIPGDTDIKSLNKINYLNACRLSAIGVDFYILPKMNHAKLMLIDGQEGVIGSQNMDLLSFNLNIEAGVFFRQKDLISDLSNIIERWKRSAAPSSFRQKKVRWHNRVLILFFKLFYPIF